MKKLIYLLAILAIHANAQIIMPRVELPVKGDLHFLSPEPIQYVDISNKDIEGDLALPNLLRLRYKKDTCHTDAIVTIAGQKFIVQYHIWPTQTMESQKIDILPADIRPLDISGIGLSRPQLQKLAFNIFSNPKRGSVVNSNNFGLKASLNHIYSMGEYIFLDVTYQNKTNLKYDIDDFHFRINDKKITKATNSQSLEVKPEFTLFDLPSFCTFYRNVFVFKKMSFPGNKVFTIELSEKQISGRVVTLTVSYKDLLQADTIPF